MSDEWTRILSMDRDYLRREHPSRAAFLDSSSAAEAAEAVERAVNLALTETGLDNLARDPEAVRRIVEDLDNQAWELQDEVDRGARPLADYEAAFRRARAANALLDALEDRPDAALYEALHGLAGDEARLLGRIKDPKR